MALGFVSLASSSTFGNAYLLDGGPGARVMVDCGAGLRQLETALADVGLDPSHIEAIFLTHGHSDHVRAVTLRVPFPRSYGIPVYATEGLWQLLDGCIGSLEPSLRRVLPAGGETTVGSLRVRAIPKPHDCVDPVGLVIDGAMGSWLFLTDLGHVPPHLLCEGRECEYLVVEANHEPALELASGRPEVLVRRVLGDRGHLSNQQAAAALREMVNRRTRVVFLAHLSVECNTPALAYSTCRHELDRCGYRGELGVLPAGGQVLRWPRL